MHAPPALVPAAASHAVAHAVSATDMSASCATLRSVIVASATSVPSAQM